MRMPRLLARRPRPAALLAAGLATAFLGAAATLGPSSPSTAAPAPRPTATVTTDTADLVTAYNGGWKAGVAALGDGTEPTHPDVTADGSDPGTVAWNGDWIDGQADALGDDNRDGVVDEDESGWDCHTMGNRQCGTKTPAQCRGEVEFADLCATVATRPAYAWTDADGTPRSVAAGRELLSRITAAPGTEEFAAAPFTLDTQWAQHNED
ncbi:hypothetical protein [Streptomyces sp. NBC_01794]|uniref:hypothetical protein n=1 Tax=Streptomyces sp. NBC_01794 TaxID=2975942 RepID=UPI00308DCE31|nr:hypothetical protein OIE54_09445 [Streptomyces sp. NBC_01794]